MSGADAKSNTGPAGPAVSREALRREEPRLRLAGRNATKADIFVYRASDGDVAVKDYRPRSWLVRHSLGRWLVRRECAAFLAAGEVPGLPRFLGRLDAFSLATGWIEARPLSSLAVGEVAPVCFERAAAILDELHRRGIALVDLHHRDVLVSADGSVHLVDLAMAWTADETAPRWRRRLFERFRELDRLALARMRARFAGGDPDGDPVLAAGRAGRWHRRGRRLKRWLDRLRGRRR